MKTIHSIIVISLFALAAPSRAQVVTPVYSFSMPDLAEGESSVGLATNGTELFLFTVGGGTGGRWYTSSFDVGGSMVFVPSEFSWSDYDVTLQLFSLALFNPANANESFLTGGSGFGPAGHLLYSFDFSPVPGWTSVALSGMGTGILGNRPAGMAAADGGAIFLSSSTAGAGIYRLPNADTGAPDLNFGNSGPGALNTPKALAFGPDGLLYVLDTGDGRIVSFNPTDGGFQSAFSLAGAPASSGMAISPDGRIFVTKSEAAFVDDVWQVADIYNLYTGDLLGHLTTPTDDAGIGAGKPSIAIEGDFLYWTSGSGANLYVYAVPEPSVTALLIGTATLAFAFVRRRK